MRYGSLEFAYAEPVADALARWPEFREWILAQTKFAIHASGAKLLDQEMAARRSSVAQKWWRSHFTERCRCPGCRGQETDLLAIFEAQSGFRFAVHIEVKQPADRFPAGKDQAANYRLRAQCWIATPPAAVVPHADATTVLLCSTSKLDEYALHCRKFDAVITFESAAAAFPRLSLPA